MPFRAYCRLASGRTVAMTATTKYPVTMQSWLL